MLQELAVVVVKWPPYSLDLNPIEKEYLQKSYGDCKFRSYAKQKERITKAWEAVATPELLRELIKGMPARMKAIIL